MPTPWADSGSSLLLRARQLIPPDAIEATRRLLPRLCLDRDDDSVDGKPMFQVQLMGRGAFVNDDLKAVLEEPLGSVEMLPGPMPSP